MIEPAIKKDKAGGLAVTPKNLRTFGVGGAVIFTVLWALRLFVFHHGNAWPLLALAGFFLITGLFIHPLMRPVYIGWTWVAHKIGWFNTRLLLAIIFYGVITPIGVISRLFGKDPLSRKLDSAGSTYWLDYTRKFDLSNYEKEF